MNTSIKIAEKQHSELMSHLHSGDGLESIAFGICGTADNGNILLVNEIIVIPDIDCIRKHDEIKWKTSSLTEVLNKASRTGASIIKFHSHPSGAITFSQKDDVSDQRLFPKLYELATKTCKHASALVTPDGMMTSREVTAKGEFSTIRKVTLISSEIKNISHNPEIENNNLASGKRVSQTFGNNTFDTLRGLKVGIVGCSGTGSPVIEQLSRTCIGHLVLVDPDIVKETNLNRITNSTALDAKNMNSKVSVAKRAVDSMGTGTKVTTYDKDLFNPDVVLALSSCDVIFGCMDSVDGRHLLNRLTAFYLIPYFDIGVKLVADGQGGIKKVCGQVHYIQPGKSSLLSRHVYNLDQLASATLFRTDKAAYQEQKKSGYIDGVNVDKPAVVTVNTLIASHAVLDFLSRIHDFRDNANSKIAVTKVILDQGVIITESEKDNCSVFSKNVGLGDTNLLLGLPEFGKQEKTA